MTDRRFAPVAAFSGQVNLPQRKTALSAGYDLEAASDVIIPPAGVVLVPTGLKAYMGEDEVLLLTIRSSLAVKRRLMLANGVGVVDADYADNSDNEGHIMVALANLAEEPAAISRGERIAQGIFARFLATIDDEAQGSRSGGFGSTGTR